MGQKVHPTGFRVGIVRDWESKWIVDPREYCETLHVDMGVRSYLLRKLAHASVSRVTIERTRTFNGNTIFTVKIHTARQGIVIGKKGKDKEILRAEIAKLSNINLNNVELIIEGINKPEIEAMLVSSSVALQLERRILFRRAMKRAVQNAMRLGALGIKICVSGRLNGAEIARSEWYREGRVPLHTLDANIDYGVAEAKTTYGIIGVKVWIYKGNYSDEKDKDRV